MLAGAWLDGEIMNNNKGLMAGKKGLIMGVANNRSIAWGIAKACAAQGAELAFTYQGDALKKRVDPLAAEVGSDMVVPCDVTDMASIDATFDAIKEKWGKLDFVVHAIAFSDKDELHGRYVDTSAGATSARPCSSPATASPLCRSAPKS